MSFWIQGWVEITTFDGPEQEEDHAWQSAINLGALVDTADEVSERLFGLSKRCVSGQFDASPLAAGRGLPPNPSAEVRSAMQAITRHEQQYGRGELGGYTYALWREVKPVALDQELADSSDWRLVFDLIRRLEQDSRYNEDRIRLVVWYVW